MVALIGEVTDITMGKLTETMKEEVGNKSTPRLASQIHLDLSSPRMCQSTTVLMNGKSDVILGTREWINDYSAPQGNRQGDRIAL